MIKFIAKHPVLCLVSVVVLLLIPVFYLAPLSIMEARNFITAREMYLDGNWITTTMNGYPRYEKPPFPTWLSAWFGMVGDFDHVFLLRLPALFISMALGLTSFYFMRLLKYDANSALVTGLVLITSYYIFGIILEAPWDIYTHTFVFIGITFTLQFFKTRKLWFAVLAVIAIGLSVLSKGPIGIYVLYLPFLLAYFLTEQFQGFKLITFLSVLLLGVLLGAVWFLVVRHLDPIAFQEITSKETNNWTLYQVKPFYYYWSFFIQSGLWTIFSVLALVFLFRIKIKSWSKEQKLFFVWLFTSLILLSVVPEKKARYLMPVLIPLAFVIGEYLKPIHEKMRTLHVVERLLFYLHYGIIILLAPIAVAAIIYLSPEINSFSAFLMSLSFIGVVYFSINLFRQLVKRNWEHSFFYSIGLILSVLYFLLPSLIDSTPHRHEHLREWMDQKSWDLPHYFYDAPAPEIVFDYGDKIPVVLLNQNEEFIPKGSFYLMLSDPAKFPTNDVWDDYCISIVDTFDHNLVFEGNKNGRDRFIIEQLIVIPEL